MRYKIQCTFTCEVEADNMEMAFAEASNVFVLNEDHSDAVVERDGGYEMEAWEMEKTKC